MAEILLEHPSLHSSEDISTFSHRLLANKGFVVTLGKRLP